MNNDTQGTQPMNPTMTRAEAIDRLVCEVEAAQVAIFASLASGRSDAEALFKLAIVNARPRVTRIYDASFTEAEIAAHIRATSDPDFLSFRAKAAQIGDVISNAILDEVKKLS